MRNALLVLIGRGMSWLPHPFGSLWGIPLIGVVFGEQDQTKRSKKANGWSMLGQCDSHQSRSNDLTQAHCSTCPDLGQCRPRDGHECWVSHALQGTEVFSKCRNFGRNRYRASLVSEELVNVLSL